MKSTGLLKWLIVLLIFVPAAARAQTYHRLAASDFMGTPPVNESFLAYTHCDVNYTYQVSSYQGRYSFVFDVRVNFNNYKSYIRMNEVKNRDMLLQVLRHEQGHYNMAYLMQCELYRVFNHYRYTRNYDREIAGLFNQVEAKYHRLNEDYELQTLHMQNNEGQDKWNAWFERQLNGVRVNS